ncbi:DUF1365 domain-containing protein [bacterium]|nr:DUF1365 domain-containing protein [bacterium]
MHSAIFEGWVRHRRFEPVEHAFRYKMFMMYLDLAELPQLFDGMRLWSARRAALARFSRADHVGDPNEPLDQTIRDLVEESGAPRPRGPIRLLTHLRYFGYIFNPASFYYCFDESGENVDAIVTEITNTPWGERHCYVHPRGDNEGTEKRKVFRFDKDFHVSPFMEMEHRYEWRFMDPAKNILIHMENHKGDRTIFDATMNLERHEITPGALNLRLIKYPFMTMQVIAGIYWNALRLRMKGATFHTHPKKRTQLSESRS